MRRLTIATTLAMIAAACLGTQPLRAHTERRTKPIVDSPPVNLRRSCPARNSASVLCPLDTMQVKHAAAPMATRSVVTPAPPRAPIPADTAGAERIRATIGPIAAGPAWYEDSLTVEANTQWKQFGAKWDAGNSISAYERPAIYYKQFALTGDTIWRSRAHQILVAWRDGYLFPAIASGSNTSPHWSQAESAFLDCKVMHDAKSCEAVSKIGQGLLGMTFGYITQTGNPDVEARIQARVIVSQWMLEKVQGSPNKYLDSAIVQSLRVMNSDGYAPFKSTCGGSLNYMNGMLYDVLTRIHDQRPGAYNAVIEAKAKAFGEWLWRTQWRAADASFNYVSVVCTGTGSPTAAPDLNGLMLPLLGWLGKTTGDSTWFTRGDQVVGGMRNASVYLYRQYSESFSSSFRYFGYRAQLAALNTNGIPIRKP